MGICLSVVAMGVALAGASRGAWTDDKSHRAAAEDLLKASNTEKAMQDATEQMMALQLRARPNLEPIRDVVRRFLDKHVSYSALKDDLIKLYMAEFTEAELKEMAAFYRTPTGRKAVERMPALFQKGAELGVKRVQENSAELRQMIDEELKKKPTNPRP